MKRILPIFIALLMGTHAFANEFFAYIGGGLSTLMYDMKGSDKSNGFGGLLGFGYNYFFTPNWGVGSGLEIAFYNAESKFKEYKQPPYMFVDFEGNEMEFRSTLNGYKEEQSVMLLQIPLMLQYQRDYSCDKFPKIYALYAAAGTKIGIPLTGDNKITADSVNNSGYRRFEDYEYKTQTFLGFGSFADQKAENKLSLQTAVLLSAEAGAKWKLNETYRLYTGAYIDYGLNSVTKRRHHPGRAIEYNSQERAFAIENLVDEAAPLAIGLKVKLSFGAGSVAEPEKENNKVEEENRQRELLETNAIAAEKEAARLASIQEGKAAHLQAKIDSIQNQVLNDFHITQTKPSEKQIPALDAIIALLKDHPELRFYINGHTCDQGDKETNRIVGYERAKAVKDYVISKGIDENRILGIGSKLYYEPLVPNTSEENRRKNRRVEFVIEKWLPPDGN